MCCDIPSSIVSWHHLSSSKRDEICKVSVTSPLHEKYIAMIVGVIQSSTGVQLTVYQRLDIPHGHRDMLETVTDKLLIIPATSTLHKGRVVQHIEFVSNGINEICEYILERLKLQSSNINSSRTSRQRVYEDRGVNGGQSHSRRYFRRKRSWDNQVDLPNGVAIPSSNITEGINEDEGVHRVFIVCSEELRSRCSWIWEKRSTRRLNQFAKSIHRKNAIEALRMSIS